MGGLAAVSCLMMLHGLQATSIRGTPVACTYKRLLRCCWRALLLVMLLLLLLLLTDRGTSTEHPSGARVHAHCVFDSSLLIVSAILAQLLCADVAADCCSWLARQSAGEAMFKPLNKLRDQ